MLTNDVAAGGWRLILTAFRCNKEKTSSGPSLQPAAALGLGFGFWISQNSELGPARKRIAAIKRNSVLRDHDHIISYPIPYFKDSIRQ